MMPAENSTWVMLYVPFVIGVLVARQFAIANFALAGMLFFLCLLRELLKQSAAADFKNIPAQARPTLILATAHGLFLVLILLFKYHLWLLTPIALFGFLLFGLELLLVRMGSKHRVTIKLLGMATLTLSAPAAHYASSGALTPVALALWVLCVLYFGITTVYTTGWSKKGVMVKNSLLVLLTHSALFTAAVALIFSFVRG